MIKTIKTIKMIKMINIKMKNINKIYQKQLELKNYQN